jgi:hypothetical protein
MGKVVQPPEGCSRFLAVFTWTHQEDQTAKKKFELGTTALFKGTDIDASTAQAYYCTGARTMVVIGYVKACNHCGIEKFCSRVIFGTPIQANVYYAVESNELGNVFLH